jgi:RNA-directed DNA polymerase
METATRNETTFTGITLEAILAPYNLKEALKRVEANKGAPGVDDMRTDELRDHIFRHPGELTSAIRSGQYRPSPVKRVSIPKAEKGKFRDLGIPTVTDRLIQQAVEQVLVRYYDGTFSTRSYGFRPYSKAQDAINRVLGDANEGYCWAVDMDLAKFFDTVDHSRLIRKLSERIADGRVISLIHRMLRSGVEIDGKVVSSEVGLMQGGPLSPLLANIYLDELDKELEKRGHRFARYADDLICLCKSKRAAERTLKSITHFVEGRMKLKVNQTKSGTAYLARGIKFLGFGFYRNTKNRTFRATVHPKTKVRLQDALREILARSRKTSIEEVKKALRLKLTGWYNYFKMADFVFWANSLDEWMRRRIRQLLWKTWKKVSTRHRALMKLGISQEMAWTWANTRKGYWHVANSHILACSLRNDFLKSHGWTWLGLLRVKIG